jgi:ppGpp synthetase/RelA/SpoT-type nucleotidyltranferase
VEEGEDSCLPLDMAWIKRQYSKGQIDRAGALLVALNSEMLVPADEVDPAFVVINNWRSAHSYPLQAIKMNLLRRAKKIDSEALIAQRLKRLPSITLKLIHNPNMKLSQMQDIGGCRAVMATMKDVKKLVRVYERSRIKNPRHGRPIQHAHDDYISNPKPDGYRSYHLIFKYQSKYQDKKAFEGQRIEIQLRSRLQHAWATAVETVQTFTGQALKAKIKAGSDPEWLRFFALMGSAIALREGCALVPGTPQNEKELVQEIRHLASKLAVHDTLSAWGFAAQRVMSNPGDAKTFLLVLDSNKKTLVTTPFRADELKKAFEMYLKVEKDSAEHPEIQAVLVSVDSIAALEEAYPNYFLDTNAFLDAMSEAIG